MRFKHLSLAALGVVLTASGFYASSAIAQDEQFIPLLVYRSGPYAPNGIPLADGQSDYYKLVNARDGGVNGITITTEECDTAYNNDRGVECYERLKANGPTGASVFMPFSTGITYALIERATQDKIPIHSMGYGRTDASDGRVFQYVFTLPTTYWSQASVFIKYIGEKEGGMDKLKGKKIALVYHDSAYGKEPIKTLQTLADMLLTLVLVLSGWGFWALILPKVLVVPVWAFINRRAQDWRPGSFTLQHWRAIVGFSLQLTGVEILATLRNNLDYLLVGYFLGVEALGVYFFAFNAGLGISLGLISACSNALFPHLCDANHDAAELRQRFTRGLRTIALIAVPLVLLQASAAPFYLPLVFGQHWVDANALPILILICLSALPRPFAEAASQLLRALGQPRLDLFANAAFTVLLTIALLIGVQWGSIGVAAAVLLTHWLIQPLFTLWVWRHFLNNPDLHPSSVTPLTAKGVAHA